MWQFHLLMGSMIQNNPIKILNLITLPLLTFLPSIRHYYLAISVCLNQLGVGGLEKIKLWRRRWLRKVCHNNIVQLVFLMHISRARAIT
ncbi:hypothetical protein G4B88_028372 [Cannabis sativa]|uniref:Uncharacterized protein n=1 Tax=Cannabis sativa TaxID=3483 RepID=A0A7J6EJD9_CANSA|nr:hypothetical protein G4B88_028372 [Cannabis sativa]